MIYTYLDLNMFWGVFLALGAELTRRTFTCCFSYNAQRVIRKWCFHRILLEASTLGIGRNELDLRPLEEDSGLPVAALRKVLLRKDGVRCEESDGMLPEFPRSDLSLEINKPIHLDTPIFG